MILKIVVHHIMEYYATIQNKELLVHSLMDLKGIILSRKANHILSDSIYITFLKLQNNKDREQTRIFQGLRRKRE